MCAANDISHLKITMGMGFYFKKNIYLIKKEGILTNMSKNYYLEKRPFAPFKNGFCF